MLYTVVYYSTQIAGRTLVLLDQMISGPTNLPSRNSDSTSTGTIKPTPNGASTAFTLSAAPTPPSSLALFVNGLLVTDYAFSVSTVIFQTAPRAGDVISAIYQV
jgi:hypothetical protein